MSFHLVPESELALRALPLLSPVKLPVGVKSRPTIVEAIRMAQENFIVDIPVILSFLLFSILFDCYFNVFQCRI